ncbi:MAG TPA: IscS subfamily cysteine desulfurase [Hanamia sp.]|nr:IscS subfamily cysteine desulfurase [Hanamia sp.]
MLNLPIYLDNNATTPMDPRVLESMLPFFTKYFGNAASHTHSFGWEAEAAVEYAREQVALLISAEPKEIVFTSGATESDNLALKGIFEMFVAKGNHIITVKTEHKAVLDSCIHLEKMGAEITYLNVKKDGLIDIKELENAIKPETILIAVIYANNETGVIQPIKEIGVIAKKHSIIFFTDGTQAIGKIPVDVIKDNIDIMSFSAHKIYGPKGVGALYVRRKNPRVRIASQIDGGGQERGFRSGTLNVPGIVGFGKACELCMIEMQKDAERLSKLRDKLEQELIQLKDVFINGSTKHRLPNVSNLSFKNINSAELMAKLSKNIALSSGSACTSATLSPSFVLKAMGLSDEMALSSLRFGLGRFNTEEEIDYTVNQLTNLIIS